MATQAVRAICRSIPESFDRAIVQTPSSPISVTLARQQHAAYVQALQTLGVQLTLLPADPAYPDCCFVEDCVVYADELALITRLGAVTRRGEEQAVAETLKPYARLEWMEAPATLDGGDCLRIGKRLFVGRSQRTNVAGIDCLNSVFQPLGFEVVEVPLGSVLHLKCVCSRLAESKMLLAAGTISAKVFDQIPLVPVPAEEAYAANCVCVNTTVLLPAGFPATSAMIRAEGFQTVELEMSEIRRADGAMTCLSIFL